MESTPERVARGKLISEMLCKECHFDAATGRLTGQRMADVPKELGAAYSKNITQDPQHGIGAWSDGEIAYLLRTGIRKDGTYTPPWMVKLPRLADEDIHSIIAFLRSGDSLVQAAPVADRESEPTLLTKFLCRVAFKPFPYPDREIKAPPISDKLAYGKYVVQDYLDCYGCHSADFKTMDAVHPEKSQGYLGGGNAMTGMDGKPIYTANLTPDGETGMGKWTEADFVKTMRTGTRPDGRAMRYPMTRIPGLTDEELQAVYAYLKTVPPLHNAVARNFPESGEGILTDGKAVYHKYACFSCHGATGVGSGDLTRAKHDFPGDSLLQAWIRNPSAFRPMTKMPGFEGIIKDEEYAPLIAYVRQLGR